MVPELSAKPSKSQWDFGDLFSPPPSRAVMSVSELTTRVKSLLERQVGQVWVGGEVTNLRLQGSGHMYFTLKDASAQLSCVLFRGAATAQRSLVADGQKVLLNGEVTVYEARGQYQLLVREVELQGVGALQLKFEKLKRQLAAEGLFAPQRKRPLPAYPQRIGLVTSPTGAAIRDVLHVIQRRQPGLEIILAPCRVQGDGAAAEIAAAIRLLNEANERPPHCRLDLILITRGGGSLEDLWAFNEEVVARAVFESAIPVVSAVGHEIDFTIADFVADVRAATPSAAAEIITEGMFASRQFVAAAALRLAQRARRRWSRDRELSAQLSRRLARVHPRRRLNEQLQRLDDFQSAMLRCARSALRGQATAWRTLADRLARVRPAQWLRLQRESLAQHDLRLQEMVRGRLRLAKTRVDGLETRVRLLGPEQVLGRGYSITLSAETGLIVRGAAQISDGQLLKTRLKDGQIFSRVELTPPGT